VESFDFLEKQSFLKDRHQDSRDDRNKMEEIFMGTLHQSKGEWFVRWNDFFATNKTKLTIIKQTQYHKAG
jgi:hypothetical protein